MWVSIYTHFLHQFLFNADPNYSVSLAELDAEHTQKVLEMEHTQQMKLKERQKFFEEAFQQDMEQYLSTGYLQIERRGKWRAPRMCEMVSCAPLSGVWCQVPQNQRRCSIFVLPLFLPLSIVLGFSWRYLENMKYISEKKTKEALPVLYNTE